MANKKEEKNYLFEIVHLKRTSTGRIMTDSDLGRIEQIYYSINVGNIGNTYYITAKRT